MRATVFALFTRVVIGATVSIVTPVCAFADAGGRDTGHGPVLLAREPPPERIRSAAEEFDMGRRAFLANDFEQAAVHFENAYTDAPRAEVLRNAIRARRQARQGARASTLAALAATTYRDDATTMALVRETLDEHAPHLERMSLTCEPACSVAADGRVVSLVDATRIGFYLEPGKHELVVGWSGDRTRRLHVNAVAAGAQELRLTAPVPRTEETALTPTGGAAGAGRPLGPAVFLTGAILTGLGAIATVVSGLDAQSNPGRDAVLRDCVGQGESCPTYQEGKSAEQRTNVLLGVTGGIAAATLFVGLFFTDWSSSPKSAARAPFVGPFVGTDGHGASGGLRGSF